MTHRRPHSAAQRATLIYAILNGTPHTPSAQNALEDMMFLDAIEESAKSGSIVELTY